MKLLIHCTAFWPQVGGAETVVMTLARGLAGLQNHDVQAGDNGVAETSDDVEVTVATKTPLGTMTDAGLPFRVVRQPSYSELRRLMSQADVIHVQGPSMMPLALALMSRKPVVMEHHGFQAACPNGQYFYEPTATACPGYFMAGRYLECRKCNAKEGRLRSLRMWALTFPRRWLCRFADANVSPTHYLSRILQVPRSSVIWYGIPPQSEPVHISGWHPPVFAFIGRLVSVKGVHLLLDAAQRLQKKGLVFRVEIIGDGLERGVLEKKSQALGLTETVKFRGFLPKVVETESLEKAAAIVLPSVGEAFGLVGAENMMRGRLVIVPDDGGLAEVVGETGLKFKVGDAEDLAACMERVLRSPELAAALGPAARIRSMELFAEKRMVLEHLELYRSLLG